MKNIIETERLILRTWNRQDAKAYYLINQDDYVMEFLPKPSLTMNQVNEFISKMNAQMTKHNHTLWAVEIKATEEMIGFVGLNYTDWKSSFTPAVEVGWRLGSQYWGKGYATEGAIVLKAGLSPAEACSTLLHELSHQLLHIQQEARDIDSTVKEVEAEAVAFVVGTGMGLEMGSSSSDYISLYNGKKEDLLQSLQRIQLTAAKILEAITKEEKLEVTAQVA